MRAVDPLAVSLVIFSVSLLTTYGCVEVNPGPIRHHVRTRHKLLEVGQQQNIHALQIMRLYPSIHPSFPYYLDIRTIDNKNWENKRNKAGYTVVCHS